MAERLSPQQQEYLLGVVMKRQANLSLAVSVVFLILIFGLPILNWKMPEVVNTLAPGGFTWTWLLLAILFYPITILLSGYFIECPHEDNFHAFLKSLVFDRADWILRALEDSRERDQLVERVRQMEQETRERFVSIEQRRQSDDLKMEARTKAEAVAQATGDTVDEEAITYVMTRLLRGEEEALRQIEERLERSRGELRAYALPTHIEQLRSKFAHASAGKLTPA